MRRNSRGIVRHPPPRVRTAIALHAGPVLALLLRTVPGGANRCVPAAEHAQHRLTAGMVLARALPLLGRRRTQVAAVPELDRVHDRVLRPAKALSRSRPPEATRRSGRSPAPPPR